MAGASQSSVIVVGGGLAGLAAAWRLSRRGVQVALLEREQRVGGRAGAHREEGFVLELVPPVLGPGDRSLLAWIGEVGLRDELLPLRPLLCQVAHLAELHEVEVRRWLDVRKLPGVRLREALRLVRLARLLRRYGRALDPEQPELAADLDDRSLADFGRLYFGASVLARWMAPLVTSVSMGDPLEMSRVQFLHHLRRHGTDRLGLLRGCLADVADRAAAELGTRTGLEVVGLDQRPSEGVRVVLSDGRKIGADAVVLAVPAPEALRLAERMLSPAERDGLAAVRYAPAVTLVTALCRPLVQRPSRVLVPRTEGSPIECSVLETGLSRAPKGLGLVSARATADYAAAHQGAPTEAVEKELLGALERLHPGIQKSIEFARVLRLAQAAPRFDVGRYREIARFERTQRDLRGRGRRLYFAGDYLVNPSFEGAVVSGERAAQAVCEDLEAQ